MMIAALKSMRSRLHKVLKEINLPLVIFCLFIVTEGVILLPMSVLRKSGPEAVNGYLYCSSIDNRNPVMLKGKWEYYENLYLFPSDFYYTGRARGGQIPRYISVPGPSPNPYGFGTYRLSFKFISRSQLFALKTGDIRSSSRIYVDGVLITKIGDPSTLSNASIPWSSPQFIVFPMDTLRNVHEIIIQTSNYNYYQGGITSPIYFGTQVQVTQLSSQANLSETMAVMSIFILATFLLILLPLHIQMGNMKYLLLFSIFFGLALLSSGEKLLMPVFGTTLYLEYTRLTLCVSVLMGMFMMLYVNARPGQDKINQWLRAAAAAGALIILSLLFSPQIAQGSIVFISSIYVLLISAFSIVRLFLQIKERKFEALFQMLGLLCWAGLFGVYYSFNRGILTISSRNANLILLAFEFVVFQILYISRHIALIYSANERLAQRMVVSDKFKVDFIEITSHELRTPLHGIINIAQSVVNQLEKRKDKELAKGHDDLELVVTLAHRMSGIINDMYHFVRTSGDSQTDLRPTNLQVEVNAVLEVFGYSIKTNNIRFINHISPNASIVFADDRKLWQVFSNLIGNATKYTDSGSITVESRLADGKIYVSVTDTGIGMPGEDVNFIFEKATRLVSGSEHAEGLGLGLYITRKLVEDMGGEIFVEWTKPNKGTRITFTLKECDKEFYVRMRSKETAMRSDKTEAQPELLNLNWPSDTRILMVDDNADNLKVISDMFRDTNIPIDTVQDGLSCLELLKKNSYDIVILDVMMPGMSGFEVCRAIRAQYSIFDLPVLMLTARDGSDEILTGFWSGANDYVIKPVDSIELRARVFTLITLKQSVNGAIKNELNFLQAQIRPHFLYNAFNTISAIALTDGAAASELIDDLSTYLRHCFRSDVQDELVPIGDELELVDAYLRIEKARFGDRLEVTMDIQPNLYFHLPPLTVQPIVENAVRHGSLGSYNTTGVHIRMYHQGDDAVIEVSDDGPGIDTDKIQAVLGREAGDKNSGVGLINVNRRLTLRYNRSLKIENILPHGTRVSIIIPMKHSSNGGAN